MLSIGICDDQADARASLRFALERQLDAQSEHCQIYEFSSGEGLLGWTESHRGELTLVFLDIEMHEINGMETARRLRAVDEGLQLVFVTGYCDYVYDGYSVGALGYLLKPPKEAQLRDILARAQAALRRDEEQVFLCRSGEISYRIPRRDILYFASDRRQVQCVTAARTYTFYGKLDEVARDLADGGFVRIHQRYLVRAAAVSQVEGSEVRLCTRETLPISRSCQCAALLALTRAMLK